MSIARGTAKKPELKEPPCKSLSYCPYGWLVEFFPLRDHITGVKSRSTWHDITFDFMIPDTRAPSCPVFGHDCPAPYAAESLEPVEWKYEQ